MSTRRRVARKKPRLAELQERLELQSTALYIDALKRELCLAHRHEKLQKFIHRKKGWRDYTR
jgi:hypothetical protein